MKIKPACNKVILRYLREDLEAARKTKSGRLYIDTTYNPLNHACQIAVIEGDNKKLNNDNFYKGDKLLVQYLVAAEDSYFLYHDGNDEIRWCDMSQVFGKKIVNGFMPAKNFVFCEIPLTTKEHYEGKIFIPEEKQNTEKAYTTTIVFIHPHDANKYDLEKGMKVVCEKNTDAVKNVFGVDYIRVPADRILAVV